MIIQATVHLESTSTLCQGRYHDTPKIVGGETPAQYEERTWREKAHIVEESGPNKDHVCIRSIVFKNCISEAAKFLSKPIVGKGKATYTKHFESGILVTEDVILPITKDELKSQRLFVPSDGRRGGSSRVHKIFPIITEWSAPVVFSIFTDQIGEDIFMEHVIAAGRFIGIGSFRVRNNGIFGRFKCVKHTWEVIEK